ncbi:hypothetical protein QQS21_007699 [Conoideocrella luteorostrata]|uniref:Uncharacterized protein n=1 Tax=Conoideocrella luteorostrata TaxID=1105319 RepID=A0AAJ0FWQ2_9HYPO|nr:hypothetical protein QQS21_007699 [Conoideocrella luteorostrata]
MAQAGCLVSEWLASGFSRNMFALILGAVLQAQTSVCFGIVILMANCRVANQKSSELPQLV